MKLTGISVRPEDTLLVERARDFLAGGPADARTLVERICQQTSTPAVVAERMAAELFAGRVEFSRSADGLWRLAGGPESAPAVAVEPVRAGLPVSSAPSSLAVAPPALRVAVAAAVPAPSFEEWKAQRDRERAEAQVAAAAIAAAVTTVPGILGAPRRRRSTPVSTPLPVLDGIAAETRLCDLSYAVVDVETTGGSPHAGHRITEIAAVTVRGMEVCEIFETLVNPQRIIPPQIIKLTGITMEMVRDKPAFREVAADVVRSIGGHVFVAHNVNFDWRFVSAEVARASAQTLEGPKLCTVRLARKLLPQLPSRSLGFVARHYDAERFAESYFARHHGPNAVWRHRAAGDAVATAYCLVRLLRDAADRGCQTWGDVQQLLGGGTARASRRRSAMPAPVKRDGSA